MPRELVVCPAGHVDAVFFEDPGQGHVVVPAEMIDCPRCEKPFIDPNGRAFSKVEDPVVCAAFELAVRGHAEREKHLFAEALTAAQELWDARHRETETGVARLYVCPDGHFSYREPWQCAVAHVFDAVGCGAHYRTNDRKADVIKAGYCAKMASRVPSFLATLCELAGPAERMKVLFEHGWAPGGKVPR